MNVLMYGLGNMGYPIAKRIATEHNIWVSDLNHDLIAELKKSSSIKDATQLNNFNDIDAVVFCLPNPDISKTILQSIVATLPQSCVIIEMSTVNPADMMQLQKIASPHDIAVMDASILAGVAQMENGSATLALGGNLELINEVKPLLTTVATKQIYFGELGAGAAAKVINNAVAHAVMVVVAEAGSMAKAAGVNTDELIKVLSDSEMGIQRPLTYRYAKRMKENDYQGGMPLDAAKKDSILALSLAQSLEVPLFAIQAAHTPYELAAGLGYGRLDYAAIAKVWDNVNKPVI